MLQYIQRIQRRRTEDGASAVEYGLLVAGILVENDDTDVAIGLADLAHQVQPGPVWEADVRDDNPR